MFHTQEEVSILYFSYFFKNLFKGRFKHDLYIEYIFHAKASKIEESKNKNNLKIFFLYFPLLK